MPFGVLKIIFTVIMLSTLLACSESGQPVAEESPTRLVRTMTVGGASDGAYQEFPGKVEASQVAALSFRVSGELSALPAREGDAVAADQLVASLNDEDQQIRLRARQGEYDQAFADFQRGESLIARGGISRSDYQRLEAAASTAQSNLEAAQRDLDATRLRAPFAGLIAVRHVENFEDISAMEPIYTLQDISTLSVKVDVPESLMIKAQRNQDFQVSASFDAIPDRQFSLTLTEVATRASTGTNTFEVTFDFANSGELNILPGMSVTVRLQNESMTTASGVLFVPAQSVLADAAGPYVFVAIPNGDGIATVKRRYVKIGDLTGGGLEVIEGLLPGDQLVTAGMSKLHDGLVVRLGQGAAL